MRVFYFGITALLFFTCLFSSYVFAAQLSPVEIQIRDKVNAMSVAQQQELRKLVNINSGTLNIAGVKRTGDVIRRQLNQLGFKTRWYAEPKSMHRAPTLIAERHGKVKGAPRLLLIGHLDTVFPANSPFKQYKEHHFSASGPGVIDDKGGVLVMLYALKALNAAHVLANTNITIVLTGDEEDSGKPSSISRKPLIDAAKDCEIALDFEPAMNLETATVGRRGIDLWTLEVHGNESHSATIFQKNVGNGAIFGIANILNKMREELSDMQYLSFNPGMVAGGTKTEFKSKTSESVVFGKENVVAKYAFAKGDMRFIDNVQKQKVREKMTAIANKSIAGTHAEITFTDGIPAMQPTKENMALLERYSDVSQALGDGVIKPFDPGLRGAGDISYVASIVHANLAGLGPVGFGTHAIGESIDLATLSIQTRRAAILIYRLTH